MPSQSGRRTPQPTARRTNKQRGLGWDHTQNRERLLARHTDGRPCWWCGLPMYRDAARNPDGRTLHADHTRARSRGGKTADRLLHASCNEARGDGSRDDDRPTAPPPVTDDPPADLGPLAMNWPTFG